MPIHEDRVPSQILAQRIRNRIMEYLEIASSFDEQRRYQAAVPRVRVANEVIEQWEDWVQNPRDEIFSVPVFTTAEQAAIGRFQLVWERVIRETPTPLPPLETLFGTLEWALLREAAKECLEVFLPRGKLPEDSPFDEK